MTDRHTMVGLSKREIDIREMAWLSKRDNVQIGDIWIVKTDDRHTRLGEGGNRMMELWVQGGRVMG